MKRNAYKIVIPVTLARSISNIVYNQNNYNEMNIYCVKYISNI